MNEIESIFTGFYCTALQELLVAALSAATALAGLTLLASVTASTTYKMHKKYSIGTDSPTRNDAVNQQLNIPDILITSRASEPYLYDSEQSACEFHMWRILIGSKLENAAILKMALDCSL